MEHYYHLGLTSEDAITFKDVRYVCMGGSPNRMKAFAIYCSDSLRCSLETISPNTDRYVIFLVGPLLICSHGMGMPSMSILLHEVHKLLTKGGAYNVRYIRMGTCGGLGVDKGSIVITSKSLDGTFSRSYDMKILGKTVSRRSSFDQDLVEDMLHALSQDSRTNHLDVISGVTMSADCFYEGQGRMDGAICEFNQEDKDHFLRTAYDYGVRNFEMESHMFGAFAHKLGLQAITCCVALLNRFEGDTVKLSQVDKMCMEQSLFDCILTFINFDRVRLRHVEHTEVVRDVKISGGMIVYGSGTCYPYPNDSDYNVHVIDADTLQTMHVLKGHGDVVSSVAIQGKTIVSGSYDKTVRVWDGEYGNTIMSWSLNSGVIFCVDIQYPHVVSACEDGSINLTNIAEFGQYEQLQGHGGSVLTVQINSHLIASGSTDQMINLWNVDTKQIIATLVGHTDDVNVVQFDGANTLWSASSDGTIKCWNLNTYENI